MEVSPIQNKDGFVSQGSFIYKGTFFVDMYDERKFEGVLEKIPLREDDVFVVGFPKSGTTWLVLLLREMYDDWGVIRFDDRSYECLIDLVLKRGEFSDIIVPTVRRQSEMILSGHQSLKSPRLLKSHLSISTFPSQWRKCKGSKVIYIARNPKDICVSYYEYMKGFCDGAYATPWNSLLENFIDGKTNYGPLVNHILGWRQFGVDDNVLHVTYEEMVRDLPAVIHKIAAFLHLDATPEDVARISKTCSIAEMRSSSKVANMVTDVTDIDQTKCPFFRKGIVGDWKNHFTVAQSELFDRELCDKLKEEGLEYE